MYRLITAVFLVASLNALAADRSISEKIADCRSERAALRQQILESKNFAALMQGKTGDEIEALIYSAGNVLTDGAAASATGNSTVEQEGRHLASVDGMVEDADAENLRSYIQNRNLLNSLYLQSRQNQN